ncbi:MAG: hypothetical protein R3F20_15665 [Planctomycetota bacterium]
MKIGIRTFILASILAVSGFAQSFNIDIGRLTAGAPGGGNPAPIFGGAAGRPGRWNAVADLGTGPYALVDVHGHPTGVTCTRNDGLGGFFGFNNGQTSGYFQSLMDDAHNGGVSGLPTIEYVFSGLEAGTYTVFTYAWSPLNASYLTDVAVSGTTVAPTQTVGGALPAPNTFALGVTHARQVVEIAAGDDLTVVATAASGFAALNGFQILRGYGVSLGQAVPGGPMVIGNSLGGPGFVYANLFTLNATSFPQGPLLGLDMTIAEAAAQLAQGPPFLGLLDAAGAASYFVPGVIPSGVSIQGVSVLLDPGLQVVSVQAPFSYTTL